MRVYVIKIFLSLLILAPTSSFCREPDSTSLRIFNQYKEAYHSGHITKEQYLQKTDSLTFKLLVDGHFFERDELVSLLSLYKKLAWNSKQYKKYRAFYFRHFMNNADLQGKGGEAIFFAEKYSKEIEKKKGKNLIELYIKSVFHVQNRNYKKAIELYEKTTPYLSSVIRSVGTPSFGITEGILALQWSAITVNAYISTDKAEKAEEVGRFADSLTKRIYLQSNINASQKAECQALVHFMDIEIAIHNKQLERASLLLKQQKEFIEHNKEIWGDIAGMFEANLHQWELTYYLDAHKNDSAQAALQRMKSGSQLFSNASSYISRSEATLAANKGDYQLAYELLKQSVENTYKELANASEEMNNLLYAHTESEFNKSELEAAKLAKRNGLKIGMALSLVIIAIVCILIVLLKKEKKISLDKIKRLNQATEIQIADVKVLAAKEERKKLGQELHDDLSGSLAAISSRLSILKRNAGNKVLQSELESVRSDVNHIYDSVRNKSHLLYKDEDMLLGDMFENRITTLLSSALPDQTYRKEIEIEKKAAEALSTDQRIELLKILQETVTNVIKHAVKANEIFVFLFDDGQNTIFQIGDNGREFKSRKNQKGFGLKSIEKRAKDMKGSFAIEFCNGTLLTIKLPRTD